MGIRTLRDLIADQTEIFKAVKKLFPMVDWKTVELDGPDIQNLILGLKSNSYGIDDLLDLPFIRRGDIKQLVQELFEYHEREGLKTNNPLLALSRAVDFTKAVILALAIDALGAYENEPLKELQSYAEQIRARLQDLQPRAANVSNKLHEIPMNAHGEIIN